MGSARSPSQCSRLPTPCIAPKAGRADAAHAWPAYPHAPCMDRTPGGAVQCLAEHRPCPRARHTARAATALLERLPTLPSIPVYSSVQYRPVTACVCTGCVGHQISTTDRTHAWVLCWGAPVLGGPESVRIVLNSSSGTATKRVAFHASSQVKETRTGEPFPREGTVHIKLSALRG